MTQVRTRKRGKIHDNVGIKSESNVKLPTVQEYISRFNNHILPHLGDSYAD